MSSVGYPKGGVPQGTVSGPRNFIMFINDLTTTAQIYKYVDNSTIFEVCQEGDTTQIQESVDMVDIWTIQNDMRLNSEKCKEMIIDFSRDYSLILLAFRVLRLVNRYLKGSNMPRCWA